MYTYIYMYILPSIRMIGKNINKFFDDKKINKSNIKTKNYLTYMTYMLIKY